MYPELAIQVGAAISELTETFARAYLANAHDYLSAIVFIHGVTSTTAVRAIMPHLGMETASGLIRYAWQAGCALYAAFGHQSVSTQEIQAPQESCGTLIDMAIATRDEHAIKFTEACVHENAPRESPAYLAAARHAIGIFKV